jgi:hypothetical protein
MNTRFGLILCAGMALGGCAGKGEFPSLSPRATETRPAVSSAAPPPPVVAASDPAVQARAQAALAKAQGAVAGFDTALAAARTAAGRGGAKGSDAWIATQMAISRLERTREPVKIALIELTEEQRLVLFGPLSADRVMVEGLMAEVLRIDDAQTAAMAGLLASVNRR